MSSGIAITRPITRGSTSTSYGSTPIDSSASTSSLSFIDADLGGEGAAGAAGDDDRRQQHAELAQHADRHEVDREDLGAERAQLLRADVGEITLIRNAISATTGIGLTPVS